jgi:hypothetical protein
VTYSLGRRSKAIRDKIVATARWGVAHEPQIHYAEVRPIPVHVKPLSLPLTTDCSGFATLCYLWGGARDPNGLGYSGAGFTGTLLRNGRRIRRLGSALAGDLIIYGPTPGHHVVVVVEPGADPLVASHGSEDGPKLLRHSDEAKAQPPGFQVRRYRLV